MNHDSPATHDEFGRRPLAKHLARVLLAPRQGQEGLVVALDGPWGSGKSTLLNWVSEELGNLEPAPIVMNFNPWRISGLDALIEAFLIELAAKLDAPLPGEEVAKGAEVGQRIVDYLGLLRHLRYLKYVPTLGFVGNVVEDVADYAGKAADAGNALLKDTRAAFGKSQGIEGAKAAVEAALVEFGHGVVVILDDLDRLNREEVRTVFQLIKSVADFRNITYLLAFDVDQVALALKESVSDADGRRYLEKIIQASFRIPPLFPWQAKHHLDKQLKQVLHDVGRELRPFEEALWEKCILLAAALCKQPRHIVRLSNHLRLSWMATKEAVNACDVLVFEALAQRLPEFVRAIQEHPDEFTGWGFRDAYSGMTIDWGAWLGDEERKDRWLRHLPPTEVEKRLAMDACAFLFPYANKKQDEDKKAHWRIAETNHLARLLQGCGLEGVPDAGEYVAQFNNPGRILSELAWMDSNGLKDWLNHASPYLPEKLDDPDGLLDALANIVTKLFEEERADQVVSHGFSRLILEILFRQPAEMRFQLMQQLVKKVSCSFSEDLVFYAAWPHGLLSIRDAGQYGRDEGPLLPDRAQALTVIDQWKSRASELSAQDKLVNEPELHSVLYRWTQLGEFRDYPPVWAAVARLCEAQEGLERFLSEFSSRRDREAGEYALVWDVDDLLERIQSYPNLEQNYGKFIAELKSEAVRSHLQQLQSHDVQGQQAQGV